MEGANAIVLKADQMFEEYKRTKAVDFDIKVVK
jgi:hypothetical protein